MIEFWQAISLSLVSTTPFIYKLIKELKPNTKNKPKISYVKLYKKILLIGNAKI